MGYRTERHSHVVELEQVVAGKRPQCCHLGSSLRELSPRGDNESSAALRRQRERAAPPEGGGSYYTTDRLDVFVTLFPRNQLINLL